MEGRKEVGEIVNNRIFFFVGNRRRIKFWKDIWYGDKLLYASSLSLFCNDIWYGDDPSYVSFLSSFAMASSKKVWMGDLWI